MTRSVRQGREVSLPYTPIGALVETAQNRCESGKKVELSYNSPLLSLWLHFIRPIALPL